jgi:hypothetical protein
MRRKNEIDILKRILYDYLDEIIFKNDAKENPLEKKKKKSLPRLIEKFSVRSKEEIINQLLQQTVRLEHYSGSKRF